MKIIILHGDDVNKSYERLKKFIETAKSRSWEIMYVDNSIPFKDVLTVSSLFGNERFFILQDIKLLGAKDLDWLKKTELSGTLIIYHEDFLSPAFLKSLPKSAKIEEFKLPKLIWSFLDYLLPGNSDRVVVQFHRIIAKDPPEFVFSLMAKHFRDLFWVKNDFKSLPYPSWRISRLKAQAAKFSGEKLRELIGELSDIDIGVKTGKADLVSSLDLFMLKQLE